MAEHHRKPRMHVAIRPPVALEAIGLAPLATITSITHDALKLWIAVQKVKLGVVEEGQEKK